MTLDVAQFLLSILLFLLVYMIAVTTSGAFKAWVAYLCGDDTAQEEGFVTLNPLMHIDPLGLFFFLILKFGWGRRIPIDSRNIGSKPKLICAYMADTFMNILTGIVALVVLVAVFGPGILQSQVSLEQLRSAYPQYTAFAFVSMLILVTLIRLSVWLAALSGISNFFKLGVLLFFPEKQDDPDAQYFLNFGPLLLMILFLSQLMGVINTLIEHAGFVIASILKFI
ncbi:MAG: hypothetical protein AB7F19_02910 [Candidatus Babeliales bacterium]